ncbi:MAG: hypothetical protein FD121_1632, partial [Gallionellaceae bacterium]
MNPPAEKRVTFRTDSNNAEEDDRRVTQRLSANERSEADRRTSDPRSAQRTQSAQSTSCPIDPVELAAAETDIAPTDSDARAAPKQRNPRLPSGPRVIETRSSKSTQLGIKSVDAASTSASICSVQFATINSQSFDRGVQQSERLREAIAQPKLTA